MWRDGELVLDNRAVQSPTVREVKANLAPYLGRTLASLVMRNIEVAGPSEPAPWRMLSSDTVHTDLVVVCVT